MSEDETIAAFDAMAERLGYLDATKLRARDKRKVMERLARCSNITPARFRDSVLFELRNAQRKTERACAGQWRHQRRIDAKRQAKKQERDFLASLSKPVSRSAGRAEHLVVLASLPADLFFRTSEWRRTRWEALELYGRRCCSCGAVPDDEARLTATHVTSRIVQPELAFDLANLRILCTDCHIGRRTLARPRDA